MKKIVVLALALCLTLGLCACGSNARVSFTRGTVTGTTYENKSIGVVCTLNENWEIASDEEIAQAHSLAVEALTSEQLTQKLDNGERVNDFLARRLEGGTIQIAVGKSADPKMSPKEFVDTMFEKGYTGDTIDTIVSSFEAMGFYDAKFEKGMTKFNGQDYPCINTLAMINVDGELYPYYTSQVFVYRSGYLVTVTATSAVEDTTPDIMSTVRLQ